MPWAGLALGTLGGVLAHQIGSDSTFQDCRVGSPLIVIIATILGLVLVALGALGSWRVYAADGEAAGAPAGRDRVADGCAIFALAIILPFIASLVIPRCWA